MDKEDKVEFLRKFLSPFVSGPNIDAFLYALATGAKNLDELSFAVNKQLRISTAVGEFLDKRTSEIGLIRPPEIGIDDDIFRQLAIAINANKQIISVIQEVLRIFYGEDAVRAFVVSGNPEPYTLRDGMDLTIELEGGEIVEVVISESEFRNIGTATAQELADIITRNLRNLSLDAFAQVEEQFQTGERFVKIYGSANGPYSLVSVLGGSLQNVLEFPLIRGTDLGVDPLTQIDLNNTAWQITKTSGNIHRFRWAGNNQPNLSQVQIGDRVMIYGDGFNAVGIQGTFTVLDVRPPLTTPAIDSGYFEINIETNTGLLSSLPDQIPPANSPGATYSYSVGVTSFDDLKFFAAKRSTPYNQKRYSLAWEPSRQLLKIYMPATTRLVNRDIISGAYLHALYDKTNFNGSFGSNSDPSRQVEVVNPYTLRYSQPGYDNEGRGGFILYDSNVIRQIDYIHREMFQTTIICSEPHGIVGVAGPDGVSRTGKIILVNVEDVDADDPDNPFLGPYIWDNGVRYTLTNKIVQTREAILGGESKNTLIVSGDLPDQEGFLYFNLNTDAEEGPVKYFSSQVASSNIISDIISISQTALNITVITKQPHGALVGNSVQISGTSNFNGVYNVTNVVGTNTMVLAATAAQTAVELNTGTATLLIGDAISTVLLDPSYTFRNGQPAGSDATLLSDTQAYTPIVDGRDYNFYITGTAEARVYGQRVIESILASGIGVEIIILYPSDRGLGNAQGSDSFADPPASDKIYVWGPDDIETLRGEDG